jgi:formylglycine-generating enzyme required for sulfatase activity
MQACWGLGAMGAALLGCDSGNSHVRGPNADEIPATVAIEVAPTVLGFAFGKMRADATLPGFRIAKHPITVAQYSQCVAAGACKAAFEAAEIAYAGRCSTDFVPSPRPDIPGSPIIGRTAGLTDRALPMTCVSADQAIAYCEWQGGRLPNLAEWQLAARGPRVESHSWGSQQGDCSKHPGLNSPTAVDQRCGIGLQDFEIGKHPAGASPLGVEDVLLSAAELVASSPDAVQAPCRQGKACYVTGLTVSSIDISGPTIGDATVPAVSASFRCAFDGVRQ